MVSGRGAKSNVGGTFSVEGNRDTSGVFVIICGGGMKRFGSNLSKGLLNFLNYFGFCRFNSSFANTHLIRTCFITSNESVSLAVEFSRGGAE